MIREKTEDNWSNRGFGICFWLYSHEHGNWIVLDDEKFEDYKALQIMPRLIETSFGTDGGLKPKHIERAKRLFETPDDHEETRKAMYTLQKILDGFAIEDTVYSLGKEENGKQCLIIKGNQTAEVYFAMYKKKQEHLKFPDAKEAAINLIKRVAPSKDLEQRMLTAYEETLSQLN